MKFPVPKSKYLYLLLTIAGVIAIDFLVGLIVFKKNGAYNGIREYLQTEHSTPHYISQPFLNYINNPSRLASDGEKQINDMGLRHRENVRIPKPQDVLRILFLGGSTTFGEVDKTEDAFPALLEGLIKDSLKAPARFKQVECLNAGLGAATSAELLIHYLLKYKYLEPDIVVIHAGINDAFTYAKLNSYVYQPDYHTSKRVLQDMPEVTGLMRLLSTSHIFSYFMIHHYYERQLKSDLTTNDFFEYNNLNIWFPGGNDSMFIPSCNAFYNNLTELVKSINSSGRKVLMVTEVVEKSKIPEELRTMVSDGVSRNRALMIQAGEELNVTVCVLDKEDFPGEYFIPIDGIHVTEQGELMKANKIAPYLFRLIEDLQ